MCAHGFHPATYKSLAPDLLPTCAISPGASRQSTVFQSILRPPSLCTRLAKTHSVDKASRPRRCRFRSSIPPHPHRCSSAPAGAWAAGSWSRSTTTPPRQRCRRDRIGSLPSKSSLQEGSESAATAFHHASALRIQATPPPRIDDHQSPPCGTRVCCSMPDIDHGY